MKTLELERNFLAIEEEFSNIENSAICIVSAPYEHSTSYGKGTSLGPSAIIEASHYVEFYDDEVEKELCFEKGIATIEPINFDDKVDEDALNVIYNQVDELLEQKKYVVTLGGEHTIAIPAIKAHYKHFPNMSILHFDAHSDLRYSYEDSIYSHASALMRVTEFFPAERISQVGIRAQCIEEAEWIKLNKINTFYASKMRRDPKLSMFWREYVVESLGDEVYITFDVDYFDPAIMPSTGTPEPDGFLYSETIELIAMLKAAGKKIIGFDVVEFAPIEGLQHPDMLAARLIYKILNLEFYR